MFLLVSVTAYRGLVTSPLSVDGYLLYLPGSILLSLYFMLVAACLRHGKGRAVWVLLASVVTFVWLCPFHWAEQSHREGTLRLVSANLQSWRTDMESASRRIRETRPDILCLQEVWTTESLETLRERFPEFRFWGDERVDAGSDLLLHGTFVGTRVNASGRRLEVPDDAAAAVLPYKGVECLVVSIHGRKVHGFGPGAVEGTVDRQIQQAREILALRRSVEGPCIVAGDFNAPPSGPAFKVLDEFHSAFPQAGRGFGFTFPSAGPLMRIDHVLGTEDVTFSNYRTLDVGSDHRAQVVEISLP